MLRYAILTHDWPHLHWDFMLEQAGVLKTWRLDFEPVSNKWITATPLPDHRIEYLNYEGPVSGNRGEVTQWDAGTYAISSKFPRETWVLLSGNRGKWQVRMIEELEKSLVLFTPADGT